MRIFEAASIRQKLVAIAMLTSTTGLLLACSAFGIYEVLAFRGDMTRDLSTMASIVGANSTAALSFEDARSATETLSALAAKKSIVSACIYSKEGKVFAQYARAGETALVPAAPGHEGSRFGNDRLALFQSIVLDRERIGTVYLQSDLEEMYSRLKLYAVILPGVLLLASIFAFVLSFRLQRVISGPIVQLTRVAESISRDKNYSIRAVRQSADELGSLCDRFNDMLAQIQERDVALQDGRDALEQRVRVRTDELETEVTERKRAEEGLLLSKQFVDTALEDLRKSEERFALAAQGANDGLWDWDLSTNEIYLSPRWKSMLGHEEAEVGSNIDEFMARIHPDDLHRVTSEIEDHRSGMTRHFQSELRMMHKDGAYRWMLSRGIAFRDASLRATRMAGSQTDITEGKVADALTGLPNRILFSERLSRSIGHTRRHPDYVFAILFLDLDRFKLVNDSLGHAAGDELLTEVARRLKAAVRLRDTAARTCGESTVARLGGDEFAVLLDDIRNPSNANLIADRIQRELAPAFNLGGREVFVSVSIGIALSVAGYQNAEDVLRDADTAMYRAKTLGKARYQVFDPNMRDAAVTRLELETDLRRAVEREEFALVYQPIVSLKTGGIVAFEALVRWNHPERGLVSPAEFISVSEETGLIVPIGRWVLNAACRQMRLWQKLFRSQAPASINVNVSGKQLSRPDFISEIDCILEKTGLAASSLNLEITESVIMDNADASISTLSLLRDRQIKLSIDDFGTGYSSLSYLNQFQFSTLKIDRSFVAAMILADKNTDIVRTIVRLAHDLGKNVVAEGVETREQASHLQSLGCEYGQGYLFAKPMASEAATALIASNPQRPELEPLHGRQPEPLYAGQMVA